MNLNDSNYYSLEANQEYMSVSQYKAFRACELKAMAQIKGLWTDKPTEAFLMGSYVHAWNEGTLDKFKAINPDLYKKTGDKGLKAEFFLANQMTETLKNDEFCSYMLQGEKEVIMTADMFGAPWKIKVDVYRPDKWIVDLKTCRSIKETIWDPEQKLKISWIEHYGHITQMAVYSEVERLATAKDKWLSTYIVAVSKETVPDKAIIYFDERFDSDMFAGELRKIEEHMPRILQLKNGEVEPVGCGNCEYCRSTKKIKKVVHWSELY